jgi:hypothetical protein
MKKNILLLLPLIATSSAFSADHSLTQTVMVSTPVVKEESLGFFRGMSDITQTREANNLHYDLVNNIYDPLNQNYIDKLDRTIGAFARTNDPRLPETFDACRNNYKGKIKIREEVGLAAHICLTNQIKEELTDLRAKLQANDKKFLEEQNKEITNLKELVAKQTALINTNLDNHKKKRNEIIKQEGDIIRTNKKATLVSHKLSRFKVPKDEYCSDDEEQNPDEIEEFYNDQALLVKMGINNSLYLTANNTDKILRLLTNVNTILQDIQALRYQ